MSTYLQLFQKAKRDCRITGAAPTSVSGNTGVLDRLANWLTDVYVELQNRAEWRWLRHEFTLPTVADTSTYAYTACTDVETAATIDRFSHWWAHDLEIPYKIYRQSTGVGGEYWLSWTPWEYYRSVYRVGSNTTATGIPALVSVDLLDRLVLGPTPDAVHILTGDYQLSAQTLSLDADIPEMPVQFHDLIVYLAMQKYGMIEGSSEVLMQGQTDGNRMMRQLELNQGSVIRLGGPMA